MLKLEAGQFKDELGRTVILRGINFAADNKNPAKGTNSFANQPCSLDEMDKHFEKIRAIGYNCIRFIFTWEALQPDHPDEFDEEYIDFAVAVVRKAIEEYGFYVFMDPHQDIWSRFSGGSGAPLWTLHAAGLDPEHFAETHAAALWSPDEKRPIKMQWASNYHRLVCLTMFTLFFAGPEYAPKAEINGQNVGIYLKDKFFAALKHFMVRFEKANLGPKLLGWESMNEPGHGLIGYDHLDKFPSSKTHVRLGTAPTPFQCLLLGQGIEQCVETFKFTSFGLRRVDESFKVSPRCGTWLKPDKLKELDSKYGWTRSWPGGCIWELHGVYDPKTKVLIKPFYFRKLHNYALRSSSRSGSSSSESSTKDVNDRGSSTLSDGSGSRKQRSFGSTTPATVSSTEIELAEAESEPKSIRNEYEHDTTDIHLFVDKFYASHWFEFNDLVASINPNWFRFMQAPVNTPPPYMTKLYPGTIDPTRVVYTPHFYDGLTLMLKRWRWLNVDAIGVMRDQYNNPLPALRFGDSRICQSFTEQFKFLKEEGRDRLGSDVAFLMSEIGIPYDMDRKNAYTSGYWDNQIRAMDANLTALEQAQVNYTLWCYSVLNTHRYGDGFAGEDLSIYSKDDECSQLEGLPENGLRAAESVIRPSPLKVAGELLSSSFNIRKATFTLRVMPRVDAPTEVYVPRYHFPNLRTFVTVNVDGGGCVEIRDQMIIWNHAGNLGVPQTLTVTGEPRFRDSMYSYVEGVHKSFHAVVRQVKFMSLRSRSGHYPKSRDDW